MAWRNYKWVVVQPTTPFFFDAKAKRADVAWSVRDYRGAVKLPFVQSLLPDKSVPIIMVKVNVCDVIDSRLTRDGFNVLNKGLRVYFPACGRQRTFREQAAKAVSSSLAGQEKLRSLLELKYHTVDDAAAQLGNLAAVRDAFVGFQPRLYDRN